MTQKYTAGYTDNLQSMNKYSEFTWKREKLTDSANLELPKVILGLTAENWRMVHVSGRFRF